MILWDGCLHIGAGDYTSNAGPIGMWSYDPATEQWSLNGTVQDEAITRFTVIDGRLTSPGTDPMGSWDYGNYYVLSDGTWETIRSIPGGLHNFDIAEYEGKLFVGLGVEPGRSPIACSEDGGATFVPVEMRKNGSAVATEGEFIRVYDLFIHQNKLYAAFWQNNGDTEPTYDLYRYENGVFLFDNQWYGKLASRAYTSGIIGAKAEFKGNLFFTTGYLYVTADMSTLKRTSLPKEELVVDLLVHEEKLYALSGRTLEDGTYRITVWENTTGKYASFKKVVTLTYQAPPLSFVYDGTTFYIGTGNVHADLEKNGMILVVPYEK